MQFLSGFWKKFKQNRRGYYSFIIFSIIFFVSLFAEIFAGNKPLIVKFNDKFYFPIVKNYSEADFGGQFKTSANYRDPYLQNLIKEDGWMIFPALTIPLKMAY
jgi:microcin C transport system permease protein